MLRVILNCGTTEGTFVKVFSGAAGMTAVSTSIVLDPGFAVTGYRGVGVILKAGNPDCGVSADGFVRKGLKVETGSAVDDACPGFGAWMMNGFDAVDAEGFRKGLEAVCYPVMNGFTFLEASEDELLLL